MATRRGEHSERELGSFLLGGLRSHSGCECLSNCVYFLEFTNMRESKGETADMEDIIH